MLLSQSPIMRALCGNKGGGAKLLGYASSSSSLRVLRPSSFLTSSPSPSFSSPPMCIEGHQQRRTFASHAQAVLKPRNAKWFIIFPVIAFGLGTWQVFRMKWKQALIDDAKSKIDLPVIPLPEDLNENNVRQYEFRQVSCVGKFLKGLTMPIGPRIHEGNSGYYLITPFRLKNGRTTILVNRGWVPKDQLQAYVNQDMTDEITIVGYVKNPVEKHSSLTPKNRPVNNEWYYLDGPTMASYVSAVPIVLNAITETPDKSKIVRFPTNVEDMFFNKHLSYIVTWYSLSAFLTGFTYYMIRHPPRP